MGEAIGYGIGFLLIYLFFSWVGGDIKNAIIHYDSHEILLEYCDDLEHTVFGCETKIKTMKITYKPSKDRTSIISKSQSGTLEAYENCIIFDAKNWKCNLGNYNFATMKNGDYYNSLDPKGKESLLPKYSQTTWFGHRIGQIFRLFKN